MTHSTTNELLGFPPDARLLIINDDDFGMCHAVCEAILRSLKDGIASSTTLMTACPWAAHGLNLLKDNPDIPFGVHLTLVSDFANYKWSPVSSKNTVPSLIDETGHFYSYNRIPELLARATIDDLEREFRAQIAVVLDAGLHPTHLDWHCLADGGRADVADLSFALAREYGLAMRTHGRAFAEQCQGQGLPTSDFDVLDSYHMDMNDKSADYARLLRELPAGLTEWAVHPSLGNAEAQALEPENWRIRRADYDFLVSPDARDLVAQEGITILDFGALQKVWTQ